MDERDERKRTSGDASKRFRRHQNWSCTTAPGRVWRGPTYWPRGVRARTELENLSNDAKGKGTSSEPARPKVPMRRAGADCSVVARKRGNARGAKGAGHRR